MGDLQVVQWLNVVLAGPMAALMTVASVLAMARGRSCQVLIERLLVKQQPFMILVIRALVGFVYVFALTWPIVLALEGVSVTQIHKVINPALVTQAAIDAGMVGVSLGVVLAAVAMSILDRQKLE